MFADFCGVNIPTMAFKLPQISGYQRCSYKVLTIPEHLAIGSCELTQDTNSKPWKNLLAEKIPEPQNQKI